MKNVNSKIQRSSYFWNILAGIVNASEAVVVLAVVNRSLGDAEAGIITLAFSVSNLAMTIGKFGIRGLQVTDVKNENSFTEYYTARIYTNIIMFIFVICYLCLSYKYNNYSLFKCQVIFLLFLLYSVEVVEDVFVSEYQRQNRLDLGSKMFTIRWIISLIVLCVSIRLFDLRLAIINSIIISIIVLIVFLFIYNKRLNITIAYKALLTNYHNVFSLLKNAFPLFISSFAYIYLNNIQKFAIDKYLTELEQAMFGYIAMPVFVIPLLSNFVIQPALVKIAKAYNEKDNSTVDKSIKINMLVLLGALLVCEVGAFLIGIPILNWIYNTNLENYKSDLLILLVGGAFLALVNYMSILLTIMRDQELSMYIYLTGTIVGSIIAFISTARFGIRGSSLSYMITMAFTAILFTIVFCFRYKFRK